MTRYTVVWDAEVEAQFIRAWVAGNSQARAKLTEIANSVDLALSIDPELKGQSRDDLSVRILAIPLSSSLARVSVAYQILPEDRQVRVVRLMIRGE